MVRTVLYLANCSFDFRCTYVESLFSSIGWLVARLIVLAGDKELVCSVIQTNPRILRKSVNNFLRPTAEFLLDLYGTELLCEVSPLCDTEVEYTLLNMTKKSNWRTSC